MANVLEFYGQRRVYALSVSPDPANRNPSYAAGAQPGPGDAPGPVPVPGLGFLHRRPLAVLRREADRAGRPSTTAWRCSPRTITRRGEVRPAGRGAGRRRSTGCARHEQEICWPSPLAACSSPGWPATGRHRGAGRRRGRRRRSSISSTCCRGTGPSTTTSAPTPAPTAFRPAPARSGSSPAPTRLRQAVPAARQERPGAGRRHRGAGQPVRRGPDGRLRRGLPEPGPGRQRRDGLLRPARPADLLGTGQPLRAVRPLLLLHPVRGAGQPILLGVGQRATDRQPGGGGGRLRPAPDDLRPAAGRRRRLEVLRAGL